MAAACCDACASASIPAAPVAIVSGPLQARTVVPAQLVVLEADSRPSRSRAADRQLTIAGLLVSAGFVAAAAVSLTLPDPVRRGIWLPLHLGLAAAAGTAIASVLPFFVASLSVAPPVARVVRSAAIASVAGGASIASLGVVADVQVLGLAGALSFIAGLGTLAVATFWPLRRSVGPRRPLVLAAYGAAIAQVAVGVALAGAMIAGYAPVVERWGLLKPAHAWLNVFGFLSVTVAATLVHLAPTVAGARIVPRRNAVAALVGLVAGAPLIALGLALGDDLVARIGAGAELVGAVALVTHALAVRRARGTWTTDPGWHRMTAWSLLVAPAWLLVAVGIAAGRILWLGAVPSAWSLSGITVPLAIGWILQVLIGAWSQLLPAIGPGDRATHGRQRANLGRAATGRLVALNLGVTLVVLGGTIPWTAPVIIGLVLAGGSVLVSLAVFVDAVLTRAADVVPESLVRAGGR